MPVRRNVFGQLRDALLIDSERILKIETNLCDLRTLRPIYIQENTQQTRLYSKIEKSICTYGQIVQRCVVHVHIYTPYICQVGILRWTADFTDAAHKRIHIRPNTWTTILECVPKHELGKYKKYIRYINMYFLIVYILLIKSVFVYFIWKYLRIFVLLSQIQFVEAGKISKGQPSR